MTLIQSMNIARESLVNNQYALTVVSHNVANVNTEGYARQRAVFEEINNAYPGNGVAAVVYGMGGAKLQGIESYADSALSEAVRAANSEAEYFNQLASMMGDIETIVDQLGDDGLLASFTEFYTACQNLTNSPTDSSTRQSYYIAAKNLCEEFNFLSTSLTDKKEEIAGNYQLTSTAQHSAIAMNVDILNKKLEELAELNTQITKMSSSITGSTNTLVDKRDALLEEISSLIPIQTKEEPYGAVTVMLNGVGLIRSTKVINELQVVSGNSYDEPIIIQAVSKQNGEIAAPNLNAAFEEKGAIGAQIAMVTTREGHISINTLLDNLDNLANNFAATMNSIQTYSNGDVKACYLTLDANGNTVLSDATPPALFVGVGAAGIQVNEEIKLDYNKIAAARVDTSLADWNKNVGNSSNALLMSESRNEYVVDTTGGTAAGVVPLNPDAKVHDFLISVTTDFAAQLADINSKKDVHDAILTSVLDERSGSIAVNLDEELADMIRYQRAYEASARVFSTSNEALQTLMTLGD